MPKHKLTVNIIIKVLIIIIISGSTGFSYGYLVHRNKLFPYKVIHKTYLKSIYRKSMQWSNGIYEGSTPFNLADPEGINNPVISASDVSDIDAAFVADPFMIIKDNTYFMFFEAMNLDTNTGDIGYGVSDDGLNWKYKKIILDEEFHLSYPCVYELGGVYYMIPESSGDNSVRLYKAVSFPDKWEFAGTLLSGSPYYDPTVFFESDTWWMFTSAPGNNVLNLFFSETLTEGWLPHPMNPLISDNNHIARPAGRVFEFEDQLYRLAQDDHPSYGIQVFAVEIEELSTSTYKENTDSIISVVSLTGNGWNSAGMHHVDLHRFGNKWRAVVDGRAR